MADQSDQRAAGWKRDPWGRHAGRYWDGAAWTDHVISAERVQGVDPASPLPAEAEAPLDRRGRDLSTWAMAIAAVVVLVLVAGVLVRRHSDAGHAITGTVDLRVPVSTMQTFRSGAIGNASEFAVGAPCRASEYSAGYADLDAGSSVVVKNEKETVIATGHLLAGTWTQNSCEMPVSVPNVPPANFYSVEVGHRGPQRYSAAEIAKAKWVIHLSITDAS